MSVKVFLLIVITLLSLHYLTYRILDYLSARRPVPYSVADIYGKRTLEKWQTFRAKLTRFDLGRSFIHYVLVVSALFIIPDVEVYVSLDTARVLMVAGPIAATALITILRIPLDYYREVVLHRAYGLHNITLREFLKEELFIMLILCVLVAIPSCLMYVFFFRSEISPEFKLENVNITPIPFVIIYLVWMAEKFVIKPILRNLRDNPQELEDGTLKDKLIKSACQLGYKGKVCICEETRDSSISYYSYIGNKVVICRENIDEMNDDEIVAVVTREMNRAACYDLLSEIAQFIISAVSSVFTLWMSGLALTRSGASTMDDIIISKYAWLTIAGILLFSMKTTLNSWLARRSVLRADASAARCGYGEDLICVLKRMAKKDFEDLNPHPLRECLFDDYPSLHHRIQAIRAIESVQLPVQ